jgi:hypothetical protein
MLSSIVETSEPLPSKMTPASVGIPAFQRCLPKRCLENGHIPSQYVSFGKKRPVYGDFGDQGMLRGSRESGVGIATGYGLDGPRDRSSSLGRRKIVLLSSFSTK